MDNQESKSKRLRPRWAVEMSGVYIALLSGRRNLRRAARQSGDPMLKRLFRLQAYRRVRSADELAGATELAPVANATEANDSSVGALTYDLGVATEVGSIAACLRSNRKLRIAIERTLAANPPDRVVELLGRLRDSAANETGTLEARLRDIAVRGFPNSATAAE